MRKIFYVLIFIAAPALSEIEQARDFLETGQFNAAYNALWPAARSGNCLLYTSDAADE